MGAAALAVALVGHVAAASAAVTAYTDIAAFQAAASSLTNESFEAAPWSPEGDQPQGTSSLGVTWTSADTLGSFLYPDLAITSLDGVDPLDPDSVQFDTVDWIEAALPTGITAVGGWITSFGMGHDTALLAYDGLDNLLGSVSRGFTGVTDYVFLGLTSDTAIAKVRFASINVTNPVGDDFALDDFTFGSVSASTAVPEPTTLTLLGAALTGLAFVRRRKARV